MHRLRTHQLAEVLESELHVEPEWVPLSWVPQELARFLKCDSLFEPTVWQQRRLAEHVGPLGTPDGRLLGAAVGMACYHK